MKLTERQANVLAFIRDYRAEKGYSPAIRDIARWFGISVHAVTGHLAALERKGALLRSPGVARSLRIPTA